MGGLHSELGYGFINGAKKHRPGILLCTRVARAVAASYVLKRKKRSFYCPKEAYCTVVTSDPL